MAQSYDAQALLALLPHRSPFLLVDRIDVLIPASEVRGYKRLTGGEWWESDTSREMPFSLVLEALAQTTGALVHDLAQGTPGAVAYFMGADRVRMREPARAGDELVLDVTLTQWRRGICRARGIATTSRGVTMSAELTTIVRA